MTMNRVPAFDPLAFGAAAVRLRSLRQEVLTANIVNADTPNFKARDIDFASALQAELTGAGTAKTVGLTLTHPAHIAVRGVANSPEQLYRIPVQPAVDGNTVDPDVERGHFVKNAMFTEAALSFLGSTIRTRISAITGQAS